MITVIHRLGNDDRYQAVCIGILFGIAGLQRLHGMKKPALPVHKPENVGHIAEWQLLIKSLFLRLMTTDHGFMPGQFLRFFIVFQMFQLPLLQLAVEGFPLPVQFGLQRL